MKTHRPSSGSPTASRSRAATIQSRCRSVRTSPCQQIRWRLSYHPARLRRWKASSRVKLTDKLERYLCHTLRAARRRPPRPSRSMSRSKKPSWPKSTKANSDCSPLDRALRRSSSSLALASRSRIRTLSEAPPPRPSRSKRAQMP